MRVHDDYKTWNVKSEMGDPDSVWSFWKKMLEIRKAYPAIIYGMSSPTPCLLQNVVSLSERS
jgi:glycosidase